MFNKDIYILGVGHNTIVTIDLAEACGYRIAGLYHYEKTRVGEYYFGHKIVGTNEDLFEKDLSDKNFAISVGNNIIRSELFNNLINKGGNIPNLIHPSAVVSKYSKFGRGLQVHALCVIDPDVIIGDDCMISDGSIVNHSVVMNNHCFVACNVVVGAYTKVNDFSFIGSGATLISGKACSIGYNSIIGAGAVVTKPVKDNIVVVGNPAKFFKRNGE